MYFDKYSVQNHCQVHPQAYYEACKVKHMYEQHICHAALCCPLAIAVKILHLTMYTKLYNYMGQCPAKSGLWGYNFITLKIARCTKQHIFASVLPFHFKFRTFVSTPFLCVKIDFCDLHIFRAVDTTILTPRVRIPHFSTYEC